MVRIYSCFPTDSFLKPPEASEIDARSMISDAVRKNENNGNLPEVTLAIRNTSSVAYGGKHLWRVYFSTLAHIRSSCVRYCAILLAIHV